MKQTKKKKRWWQSRTSTETKSIDQQKKSRDIQQALANGELIKGYSCFHLGMTEQEVETAKKGEMPGISNEMVVIGKESRLYLKTTIAGLEFYVYFQYTNREVTKERERKLNCVWLSRTKHDYVTVYKEYFHLTDEIKSTIASKDMGYELSRTFDDDYLVTKYFNEDENRAITAIFDARKKRVRIDIFINPIVEDIKEPLARISDESVNLLF